MSSSRLWLAVRGAISAACRRVFGDLAAGTHPQTALSHYSEEIGQFWLLHLRYKHAHGRNAQRFQINRELIALAFFMKDQGVPLDTIRAVARAGLGQAKADYGTQRDPFQRLAAA